MDNSSTIQPTADNAITSDMSSMALGKTPEISTEKPSGEKPSLTDVACIIIKNIYASEQAQVNVSTAIKDSFNKTQSQLHQTQPVSLDLLHRLQTQLTNYYTETSFVNRRLFDTGYFSLADYFVNLQMMKADKTNEVTQSNDDKCSHKPLRARDRLAGKKAAIAPSDLFQPSAYQDANGKSPSSIDTVVVSGAAGVGKTTLMDYIAYQWALFKQGVGKEGLWSDFDGVLIVRCRSLRSEIMGPNISAWSIAELLRLTCWNGLDILAAEAAELLSQWREDPDKYLLLLDGLDELPMFEMDSPWHGLLKQLFGLPFKKLVTARLYAIGNLQQWLSHDRLVEIQGFSDEDVLTFFNKHLGATERTNNFIKEIKRNPDLWAIAHIPINAYLLKIWWETTCQQDKQVLLSEMSVSNLYESLMVNVCRRYLAKIGELDENKLLDDESVLKVPSIRCLLDTLGCWAFEGLRQDTAQLPISWLKGIQGSDESPTLLSTNRIEQLNVPALRALGLLKQVGYARRAQERYEFLHLSFQEFLAANVIAVALREGAEEKKTYVTQVIHRYKYHPNFTLVWPSVAGSLSRYPTALNDFLSTLVAGPKDWVGFVEFDLQMRCLDSSLSSSTDIDALGLQHQTLLRAVKQRIHRFNKLPKAWQWATIDTLSMCPRLIRFNADTVWEFLQDRTVNDYFRGELANSAVAHLSQTPELVDAVLAFLRDETVTNYVRVELASSAVSHLSPTPELVDAVWVFLRDETVSDSFRVELASSAVSHLSPTPELVDAVLVFLRDETVSDSFRVELASSAVAPLSQSPKCVSAVLAFLRDETVNKYVRVKLASSTVAHLSQTPALVDAVWAFLRDETVSHSVRGDLASSAVAHWSQSPELVDAVLAFLRDETVNKYVRVKLASSTVAHLSQTPALVDAVWAFLRDEQVNRDVRIKLASSAVAHWSQTPALVDAVWAFLRDGAVDFFVRVKLASSAVAHWSQTPALVDAVWAFLRDEQVDRDVRGALASSAGVHWSQTSGFVDAVLASLRDEQMDKYVRSHLAVNVVAHWSQIPECVDAVLAFLRDEQVDRDVRAALASSAVAYWSQTPELVDAVLAFLRDETVSGSVRNSLVKSAVSHWPPARELVDAVLAFLWDEQVDRDVRAALARRAVAHWSQTPELVDAVLALLQDETVSGSVRGKLAISAVAHLSQPSELVDAVWALLRDETIEGYVCRNLAKSAIAHLSPIPECVGAACVFLRDKTISDSVRGELARSAVAHWSQSPELVSAVCVFLRDKAVEGSVCCDLAKSAIAHLPQAPELVDAVLVLLQDEQVDGYVRVELAISTIAHLPPTPELVDAVLTLLRDETVSKYVSHDLASSAVQQLSKWPNKAQAFLDSLFVKDSNGDDLSQYVNIPVHLLLPLYKKTHDEGRQYIRKQLVEHCVLVYEQAGAVLVTQAGQTEKLTLPPSLIQQIQKDMQPYRINIDNSVSTLSNLNLFFQSVMSFVSPQDTEKSSGQTSHSNIRRVMQ